MDNNFYLIIKHLHSILRWFLLVGLIATVIISLLYMVRRKALTNIGKLAANITVRLTHLQFTIGLVIYFISPKVIFNGSSMQSPFLRFYLVEHIAMMILSVVLISVGYNFMKKKADDISSARTIFWFFLAGLILVLLAIPWPFRSFGGTWF